MRDFPDMFDSQRGSCYWKMVALQFKSPGVYQSGVHINIINPLKNEITHDNPMNGDLDLQENRGNAS